MGKIGRKCNKIPVFEEENFFKNIWDVINVIISVFALFYLSYYYFVYKKSSCLKM